MAENSDDEEPEPDRLSVLFMRMYANRYRSGAELTEAEKKGQAPRMVSLNSQSSSFASSGNNNNNNNSSCSSSSGGGASGGSYEADVTQLLATGLGDGLMGVRGMSPLAPPPKSQHAHPSPIPVQVQERPKIAEVIELD